MSTSGPMRTSLTSWIMTPLDTKRASRASISVQDDSDIWRWIFQLNGVERKRPTLRIAETALSFDMSSGGGSWTIPLP
jgi:hypothetical protein